MAAQVGSARNGIAASEPTGVRHAWDTGARVLLTLNAILDRHHPGLVMHGREVSRNCVLTARRIGIPGARLERLMLAGVLHDIGKVAIPDQLLDKPGPLTAREWRHLRGHPEIGAQLIRAAGLEDAAAWILAHHERVDGRGYPRGLKGDEIPLEARILAVADAFDAMTSDRPYRTALSPGEAIDELRRGAGSQFDRDVTDDFIVSRGV